MAHRLEDFIEAASLVNNSQLLDVQVYVDRIREILKSGQNASKEHLNLMLADLPTVGTAPLITQDFTR